MRRNLLRPNRRNLPGTLLRQASLEAARDNALSRRDLVRLASSPGERVIRVGGGAALMSAKHGKNVGKFLAKALGGSACNSAVLAGASMSIDRPTPGQCELCDEFMIHCPVHGFNLVEPKPGVMGVLTELARLKAPARTIGVVPTINDLSLYGGFIVVENDPDDGHYTVVDGRAPICLMLQFSTDRPKLTWDDEWRVCLDYMEMLRNEAEQPSLHFFYNGGQTTRNECLHVASLPQGDNPWNMLLVEDSGRTAEDLANDTEFRNTHKHVVSCKSHEAAAVIREMGFSPEQ